VIHYHQFVNRQQIESLQLAFDNWQRRSENKGRRVKRPEKRRNKLGSTKGQNHQVSKVEIDITS
jgi:hypothetical protein